jgi:hypothetical protein
MNFSLRKALQSRQRNQIFTPEYFMEKLFYRLTLPVLISVKVK